jgi:pyrroloquinoline-quinone synthase
VVARPEWDDHERKVALDCHFGHGRERTVAPGHPERDIRSRPRELGSVVVGAQEMRVDPTPLRFVPQVFGLGSLPGLRVDDEEAAHRVSIAYPPRKGAQVNLIERLDAVRERWDLLEHPFYRRWSCGELRRDELADYASEYRHAVVALAETAAKSGNAEHAKEEAEHVLLWDEFAATFAADTSREPSPETAECVVAWTAPGDRLEALAVMYAIEAGQPAVSQAKLEGLAEHYGVAPDESGAVYFALHSLRDHEHAADSRRALEKEATPADADRLVEVAESALKGNWTLLDGVEARR